MNVIKRVNVVVRDNARRPDLPDGVDFVVVEDGGDFMLVEVAENTDEELRATLRDLLAPPIEEITPDNEGIYALLFPAWRVGHTYVVDDVARFADALWRCRQAHTSQLDWQPPDVLALWNRLAVPGDPEWLPGVAYAVGDEVTYNGITYRCLQAHTSQVGWHPPVVPALWFAL